MIQLMQGDCLELMKDIPDGGVDMVLTDPPYGTTACKWDTVIDLDLMWEQLKRVTKPNGAIVMTASQPFTTTLIASNMKIFKYTLVWYKNVNSNFMLAKKQPLRHHEEIVVFYKTQPTYNPQMVKGTPYIRKRHTAEVLNTESFGSGMKRKDSISDIRYPKSVIEIPRDERQVHPTQKPVALMEYLIKTYTNEGETVLDFTMGSGTTIVAAKNLNRNAIGIELDETYFNLAKGRIENA